MAPTMSPVAAASIALLLAAASAAAPVPGRSYTNGWVYGRATFFGRDGWSLHRGSCGFGFVCPNRWSNELQHGYDLVAISDKNPLFKGQQGAQCGQCLEVACRNAVFYDRYGERLDRTSQCTDTSASVKVKIIDTCACNYPPNAAGNARWCCGDMPHLDMSQWALEKLINNIRFGVFAIKYRTVSCNATIRKEAKTIPIARDPYTDSKRLARCNSQSSTQNRDVSARKGGRSSNLKTSKASKGHKSRKVHKVSRKVQKRKKAAHKKTKKHKAPKKHSKKAKPSKRKHRRRWTG